MSKREKGRASHRRLLRAINANDGLYVHQYCPHCERLVRTTLRHAVRDKFGRITDRGTCKGCRRKIAKKSTKGG